MTNQLDNDFGIRLRGKLVSLGLKCSSEFVGIVQSAVVDESNLSGGVNVGMGIFIRLSTMSGPTSMSNAH